MQAVVIGAGGGIGAALVRRLAADARFETVHALSRGAGSVAGGSVRPGHIDLGDPASITAAAEGVGGPLDLVVVATGLLHEAGRGPERSLRDLDPDWLARSFAINTIGPALVLRDFAPRLPRAGRATLAVLSARVGSISDNALGGWHSYRASKAALNMMVRCAAIELRRTRPDALCVALHPGTVDTAMSRPFQANVSPNKLFDADFSAERLLAVIDGLAPAQSGRLFAWDGQEIAP